MEKEEMMKKSVKRVLLTTLMILMVFSATFTAFGAEASAPASIQVLYDGQYITFKDAVPQIVNGRTMVPFRQILEEMGMTVDYEAATRTVTAVNDALSLSFQIGGSDINIEKDGQNIVKKMDVVPFIEPATSRTFVSARFMAESLGYNVGWDNGKRTVLINDFEKLFANAATDFSIFNLLLSTDLDLEKTYTLKGSFDSDIEVSAVGETIAFSMEGAIDGIQHKTDADMTMRLAVDASEAIAQMPEDQQAAFAASIGMLKDITMKMKINGTDGIMYMNAPVYGFLDPSIDANTWLKMDMFKIYDEMGFDIRPLMDMSSSPVSLDKLISSFVNAAEPTDIDTYKNAKAAYTFLKNLIGDDAFKKSTVGNTSTYTLKLDTAAITAAYAKTVLTQGMLLTPADLAEMKAGLDAIDFTADLTIKTNGGKLATYAMKGSGEAEGMVFDFNLNGTPLTTDMTMEFSMDGMMKMSMTITSVMAETLKSVDLSLPAGAKIVDYETLMPN
jgi:hypothetical protein